jgi:glycerophosphoryl diester phosphodiesterase
MNNWQFGSQFMCIQQIIQLYRTMTMAHFTLMSFLVFVLLIGACQSPAGERKAPPLSDFDWQGHRGARGLLPENSVPSFHKALEYPVRTLELDLAISKDSQIVLSHEPWMSHHICALPDGQAVSSEMEKTYNLFEMTLSEIQRFDCGARGNRQFPEQEAMPVYKPTLREVVEAVDAYCREKARDLPNFNIEIKSNPEWDERFTPSVETFARLVVDEIRALGIQDRGIVQSFDPRALRAVKALAPGLPTALLVGNYNGVAANLEALGYRPEVYSPYYKLVSANVVRTVHEQGMKIIPWTVNEVTEMRALIQMGVDGIITDYPDRISETW